MTEYEIDDLAKEIYSEIPNGDIKKYIRECIKAGKTTTEEIKECVKFKIAQKFKRLSGSN